MIEIRWEGPEEFREHGGIPISFVVSSRLSLPALREGRLEEIPADARIKDYDLFADSRPASYTFQFDVSPWGLVAAFEGPRRVGGVIVACCTPTYELLEGRDDLAYLVDFRIEPAWRGQGLGRRLFTEAVRWCRSSELVEVRVETQEINVVACRFYQAMGLRVISVNEKAYPGLDEAQVIWGMEI